MLCDERYHEFKDDTLDTILLHIKKGSIKCGRYAHLVKIDKSEKMNGKEFFTNGGKEKGQSESGQRSQI